MKPPDFVAALGELVAAGRDREALELSAQHYVEVAPQLDDRTLDQVQGLLASARMSLDLEEWQPVGRTAPDARRPEPRAGIVEG